MAASDTLFFKAGITLRKALLADDGFKSTGASVFPVSVEVSQKLPFVTFYRTSVDPEAVKTGRGPRSVFFQFQIYSDDWEQGLDIAAQTFDVLDGYADETIRECRCTDAHENHDPTVPAYIQILTFKVKLH